MVLHVGVHALRSRRGQLRGSAGKVAECGDASTSYLLLFYATECAIKERVLSRRGQRNTSGLEPTHDLRKLAKELCLPRSVSEHLASLDRCRISAQGAGKVALADLHQAWRYGTKLNEEDEKNAHASLHALIAWCEQD